MADAVIRLKITGSGPGTLSAFRRQLERPEKLVKLLGYAAASEAQKSFDRQGLHFPNEWEPRYPSQSVVFVNIAGCLMDLAKGPTIKPHRFDNRPAVIDTGMLRRSLAPAGSVRVTGTFVVEVGTTLKYASQHQFGGEKDIPITQTMKDNLRAWYKRQKGREKKRDRDAGRWNNPLKPGDKMGMAWLRAVMAILAPIVFHKDNHHQLIIARPFVGMNDDLEANMRRLAIDFFSGKGVAA